MDWKKFDDEIPESNKFVILFRFKRMRYLVAKFGYYLPSHSYELFPSERKKINCTTNTKGLPRWF